MITDRAMDLGRLVGQSDEYQALKRANDRLMEDKDLRESLEQLRRMQMALAQQMDRGQEPTPEQQAEMDRLLGSVQGHPGYQGVVAAQSNFDKLMMKINDWILDGIKKGSESRIITLG